MRSQSLFNFLTKVADVQTTPGGATILPGKDSPALQTADKRRNEVESARKADKVNNVPAEPVTSQKKKLVRRDVNGRVTPKPAIFRGGYAVNPNDDNVDWTAQGDGSINIYGARFTDDQYKAYNNVRSSLVTAMRQQKGLGAEEAHRRATRLANQWAADRAQVAAGGRALNRWQHVDKPALKTRPKLVPTSQQLESITSSAPANATGNLPLTLGGTPDFTASEEPTLTFSPPQPAPQPAPEPQPAPHPSPQPAPEPQPQPAPVPQPAPAPQPAPQPGDAHKDTVWTEHGIREALNAEKTKVAEGLRAVPGYDDLLFTKDGDPTGGIYDRTGKQLSYKGKAINNDLLLADKNRWWEFWKDGDYGADILHNAHQAMQSRATSNYGDAEMNRLGFTKVPGSRRWYRNAKGQFVDISGTLADRGTTEGQLSHGRTVGQRWIKDTMDPFGIFFGGEREDIGTL